MPTLRFTLAPEGVIRMHDAIVCLGKFSEAVALQAGNNDLVLTSMNSSHTAYAAISLQKENFFQSYLFTPDSTIAGRDSAGGSLFTCQFLNKALLAVFKGRTFDAREKETSVEKCEASIQDRTDKAECRLVVKMICRHGVKKTYKLTYESVAISHAGFDLKTAKNNWSISAHTLKTFAEYFGPKTEQLDIYHEGGRAAFTSYTEKIVNGAEILKQPLQTSIAIDVLDFDEFNVEERLHIGISVKDFKAIVIHAETLKTNVNALYSYPKRPLQLTYGQRGMQCKYILMTIGEYRGGSVTPAPGPTRGNTSGLAARSKLALPSVSQPNEQSAAPMPPPLPPASRSFVRDVASQHQLSQHQVRPTPPPPRASINQESLFLSDDEEEGQWGEKNYEQDEDELGWGGGDNDSNSTPLHRTKIGTAVSSNARYVHSGSESADRRVPPSQRLSQIRGLFDD